MRAGASSPGRVFISSLGSELRLNFRERALVFRISKEVKVSSAVTEAGVVFLRLDRDRASF